MKRMKRMTRMTALVMCLSHLHNFYINSRLANSTAHQASVPVVLPAALSSDKDEISIAGRIMLYKSNQKTGTRLHLKEHYLTVVNILMMLTMGTCVLKSKELPQEMLFFLVTSFMIWSSQRVLFIQHLLLGGTRLHHTPHNLVLSRD
jgi:hypothetical protein